MTLIHFLSLAILALVTSNLRKADNQSLGFFTIIGFVGVINAAGLEYALGGSELAVLYGIISLVILCCSVLVSITRSSISFCI